MRADPYLLAGRYRLMERLGEGGAGTVWRAVDENLNRQVAVKQMRVPGGLTPDQHALFVDQAIHEARSAGRLRDPAIVMIHDVVLDGGRPWIIMDLATGRSLDKVIQERGPLPPQDVARIGLWVLSALEVAHAHGMLHHDVKPANILLDADGSAVLTDFGIATPMDSQGGQTGVGGPGWQGGGSWDGGESGTEGGAGSPGFMAPERLNLRPSGPSSDLWSLGASLYTAVEGRPPFERPTPAAVSAAVLLNDPPFPARAGGTFGGLLVAMLAKDPALRPTADQVRAGLSAASSAPPAPLPERRGRRWWLVPFAIVAAALLGAGGWYGLAAVMGGPETGRFAGAPDPCGLIGDAQATELLGGAVRKVRSRQGECQWQARQGAEGSRSVTVRVWAERPNGDHSGPAMAERRFSGERTGRAGAEGTSLRTITGGVGDVTGVGDAAFAQSSFERSATSNETGRADSMVLFRLSNLLGEVIMHHQGLSANAAGSGKETAISAARLVSAELKH